MALAHDAGSSGASSRKTKSTYAGTALSTLQRSCTSGASRSNAATSKRSAGHGAPEPSQGWQAATNSATGIARTYSSLNDSSFFSSKNAGAEFTSSSRNVSRMTSHGTISRSPGGAQPSVRR